jgi:hypothetical protein
MIFLPAWRINLIGLGGVSVWAMKGSRQPTRDPRDLERLMARRQGDGTWLWVIDQFSIEPCSR